MKILLFCLGLAVFLGAAAPILGHTAAEPLEGLQVIDLAGRFLDPAGAALEEYDYLKPGLRYRLMPGARVELATLDGLRTYSTAGPGILSFDLSGAVVFNGQPLSPSQAKSRLDHASTAALGQTSLGGARMRSQEGVYVEARSAKGGLERLRLYSGYYALVVGCGSYRQGWPQLPNPVKDAREVAAALKVMGWEVELIEDPNWEALRKALNSLITGPGRRADQAVLVWFSGHGHTLAEADGSKLGYIVPVDAPDPDVDELGFMELAISMRQVETVARRVQAKHVLMIFDSCFSGAIFQLTRAKPSPFIQDKAARPVRQFLTAGNETEKVPDKSLFKTVFIQGVTEGEADLNRDGYVTGQELGAYMQERVVNYSRGAQHPQYGKINNPKLDKGDFIFVLQPSPAKKAAGPDVSTQTEVAARSLPPSQPQVIAREPLVGQVQVTTEAEGVEFFLAGRRFEAPPNAAVIVGGVPVGEHEVVARRAEGPDWRGRVVVRENETASLTIDFKDEQKGRPAPAWATKEIEQMLRRWTDDWNKLDESAILDHYADEAIITTKVKAGLVTVPKRRFAKILEVKVRNLRQRGGFQHTLERPHRVEVRGDQAEVEVVGELRLPERTVPARTLEHFKLIKRGSRWLIVEYGPKNP